MSQSVGMRRAGCEESLIAAKVAPAALMLGAGMQFVTTILALTVAPDLDNPTRPAYSLARVVLTSADLLVLIGIAGLARTGAVRGGWLKWVAFAVAVVGFAGGVIGEVVMGFDDAAGTAVFGVAGPLQALGLLLVGIAVVRNGTWRGWHRFTPFAAALYVPLVVAPVAASGRSVLLALPGLSACLFVLGVAFAAEQRHSV